MFSHIDIYKLSFDIFLATFGAFLFVYFVRSLARFFLRVLVAILLFPFCWLWKRIDHKINPYN